MTRMLRRLLTPLGLPRRLEGDRGLVIGRAFPTLLMMMMNQLASATYVRSRGEKASLSPRKSVKRLRPRPTR